METNININLNFIDNVFILDDRKYRWHIVANFDKDTGNITLDKRLGENGIECAAEWKVGYFVANKLSFMLEAFNGQEEDMILEYNGLDDLIELTNRMLALASFAVKVQWPYYSAAVEFHNLEKEHEK